MKKDDGLGKLYHLFTGEERFRLQLEALYRGDEAELKRLLESCPRETYSMNETGFTNRYKASKEITGMLCSALAPLLAKLETIERFREALPYILKSYFHEGVAAYLDQHQAGTSRASEAVGKMGDPPECKPLKGGDQGDKGPEIDQEMQILRRLTKQLEKTSGADFGPLVELEREALEEALTIWTAFAHCCSEKCEVEPEKLVKVWFEPMLSEIERLKHLWTSTKFNPEMLKDYETAFKNVWRRVVGPD